MTIGMTKKYRRLDPKLCFETWMETGSVYKSARALHDKYGIYNKDTGKPFSHQGVWESANSYLLNNMIEARKYVESVWKANGELLTDQDWYRIVLEKANHLPRKKYEAFLEQHKYLTPYLKNAEE